MPSEEVSSSSSYVAPEASIANEGCFSESGHLGDSNHVLRATAESILATVGDAEDVSHDFLDDLLDGIFDNMRVTKENERAFHVTAAYAWRQAFDGFVLAASDATPTLDSEGNGDGPAQRIPQFLRPRIEDGDSKQPTNMSLPRRRRRLNRPLTPVVPFLTALWNYIDRHPVLVETQLATFPSARFRVSAVPTHARLGEWEIPVSDLKPFLQRVIATARLSVLTSGVDHVVDANASLLEKKIKAKSPLQLSHIMLCVQTALLQAEEATEDDGQATAATKNGVFQTELQDGSPPIDDDELLVYYDEGSDPSLLAIDRKATGNVLHKPELGSTVLKKRRMVKSIVSLMQRRESTSKWGAIRKRMLVHENHVVFFFVETDMVLTPEPMLQKTPPIPKLSPKKKPSAVMSPTPRSSMPLSPSKQFSEPDAATLSNIFSLGTPRQLSPEELARRNDILSLLEREEAKTNRKMAVATITSVSVSPPCVGPDGKPIMSEQDKAFQAYTTANSSITISSGSCVVPGAFAVNSENGTGKHSGGNSRSRLVNDMNGKTRFELALESPRFEIAEGNSHAHMAAAAAAAEAMSRKSRSRGGLKSPVTTPGSPTSVVKIYPRPPPPQQTQSPTTHHPRPIGTASGHLPQLDTSRLAVGVKAVVRGIEKRGPRHDPSRNSRLRLHNYMSSSCEDQEDYIPTDAPAKVSPEKRDHLPPVSPIKASPHRKHVAFPPEIAKHTSPQRPPMQAQESTSPVPPFGSRRHPAKQPTFEKRASPPRVRNRFLTENAQNSTSKKHFARVKWEEREAYEDLTAINAPRRDLAYHESTPDY